MFKSSLTVSLLVAALLTGCVQTPTPSQTAGTIGCDIDSKRICEEALRKNVDFGQLNARLSSSYAQQNGTPTQYIIMPIRAPGGSRVDLSCEINVQNRTVIYATANADGAVSESDQEWLKQVGYCRGVPGTVTPPPLKPES